MFKFSQEIKGISYLSKRILPLSSTLMSTAKSRIQSSTVDIEELANFAPKAEVWWDQYGPSRDFFTLNKLRVPFVFEDNVKCDHDSSEPVKILDVGCGGGILSEALAKCNAEVTGIDVSQDLIDIAAQHSEANCDMELKPKYFYSTIENHAKDYKNYYDKVVASEVIEHVTNKKLFVKSCVETLKPGGKIIFTCPAKTRLSQLVTIIFCENVLGCPPKGTHQYGKFITPEDLRNMLESNGCAVEEIKGFAYNIFTRDWFWRNSPSLFFATRAVKIKAESTGTLRTIYNYEYGYCTKKL